MTESLDPYIKAFPLERYLTDYGVEFEGDREWTLTCPKCGKQKLVVNMKRKVWHCWVCEKKSVDVYGKTKIDYGGGGIVALIAWLESLSNKQAADRLRELAQPAAVSVDRIPDEDPAPVQKGPKHAVPIEWPEYARKIDGILPYMAKRRITMEDVLDFGLAWCDRGQYYNRLVFPVWEDGRLVYWQARAMWEANEHIEKGRYIKALNPTAVPGMATSYDVLFNLDVAGHFDTITLTEGPIDAVRTGRNAVCTFGKQMSDTQIVKLYRRRPRRVEIMYDGPSETEPNGAFEEMIRLGKKIRPLFEDVRIVYLPAGDPGDYTREQLNQFRAQAASVDAYGSQLRL